MDPRRIAVLLAGAAAFINLYAPQSLLPELRAWMGSNTALAGLVISASTAGVAVAAPFIGWFADHFGRRRVIVAAAWIAILPSLLVAVAQTPAQLIIARFIEGLTLPGVFTVTVAYIGDEWPPQEARSVTSLYVAGTIAGGFSGRFVAGVVGEFAGWRGGIAALAIVQLVLAIAIHAWLKAEQHAAAPHAARTSNPLLLLKIPTLRAAYLCGPVILFALVAGFTYVTLLLAGEPWRLGSARLSGIFGVYLVGMLVTPIAGRVMNAIGPAWMMPAMWGLSICGLLLTLLPSLAAIIAGLCLFSMGLFFAQTTVTSVVGESAPQNRGAALGMYSSCYYVGGSLGGVAPAAVWSHYGWPAVVALIAVVGSISAAVMWQAFRERERQLAAGVV
jgi:predicted MFS family arabinose efflux permease